MTRGPFDRPQQLPPSCDSANVGFKRSFRLHLIPGASSGPYRYLNFVLSLVASSKQLTMSFRFNDLRFFSSEPLSKAIHGSADSPEPSLSPRINQEVKCAWHRPRTWVRILLGRLCRFFEFRRICENVLRIGVVSHRFRTELSFHLTDLAVVIGRVLVKDVDPSLPCRHKD
jgi:hypothetical protein